MKELRKSWMFIYFSIGALVIACSAICLSQIAVAYAGEIKRNFPIYLVGIIFWAGLCSAYEFLGIASFYRKRYMRRRKQSMEVQRVGIMCFFRNKEARVIDIMLLISILVLAILWLTGIQNSFAVLGTLALSIFLVNLHGIVNGRTYCYLKRIKQENKRKKLSRSG